MRRTDNGTALLGGSPFRLVRLSAAGSRLLDQWLSGEAAETSDQVDQLRRRLIRAGLVHPIPDEQAATPSCAFVVPVFDDAAGLGRLLKALRDEFCDAPIMVVDDASPDAAALAHVAERHGAVLLRHAVNLGPGAARNTGWRHRDPGGERSEDTSAAEVTVFVDADVVPAPGSLRTMLAHFVDPELSAVAPRVRASSAETTIAAYEADNSPLDMGSDAALVFPGTRLSYVPSATLAVRTTVLVEASGFDDAMRFGEDVDLVWRLIDQGHMVRYEPAAVVEHRNRRSLAALARQRFSYGSSAAELAARHGSKVAPLQLPANVIVTTLGFLFGGRRARVASTIAAAASVGPLANKLEGKVDAPAAEATRLTVMMHGYALHGLAAAATRSWAPLLMMMARRSRRALAVALVVPALIDWFRARPPLDPVTYTLLRALDHGSYCAGVWAGVLRSRSVAALLPSVRLRDSADD